MKIQHGIKTCSVSWLSNTYDTDVALGEIGNYYVPDNMEEFINLCKKIYKDGDDFLVVGHTSNIYFRPNTNLRHVISTKKLTTWYQEKDVIVCECGVHVKKLVQSMVTDGIKGYACMIDLPGTVGAAIYGNASVSHDSIANQLIDATMLLPDGTIKSVSPEDLCFQFRSSALKRREIEGIILSCRLKCEKGDKSAIEKEAENVHKWRLENQPGPSRNLGTTSLLNNRDCTLMGMLLRAITKVIGFISFKRTPLLSQSIMLSLVGVKYLNPYMRGLNRYMWIDSKGHEYFDDYLKLIHKIYKNPKLEIEVI